MSLHKAVHDVLLGVWTADTGSGGINKSDSTALIRKWGRIGDPNSERDRTRNRPFAMTDVAADNPRDSATNRRALCLVRVHVISKRDEGFTRPDAICARLRVLLLNQVLATTNGWTFAPIARVKRMAGPTSGDASHTIIEFQVVASTA